MHRYIAILLVCGSVFGGFILHGGHMGLIWQPVEMLIIFGAALGNLLIASKMQTITLLLQQLKLVFTKLPYNKDYYNQLLSLMYELINVAKVNGVKALDSHVEAPENSSIFSKYELITKDRLAMSFMVDAFRLVISSQPEPHVIESVLEEEIRILSKEYTKPYMKLFHTAEALPGLGIVAAVLGIILTMQSLDGDVTVIGANIATALTGTFMGVLGCYGFFGPMADAVKDVGLAQMTPLECIKSVITGYCSGQSAHLCVNAGRRNVETKYKPTFTELEETVKAVRG